jgi:hypothetical protein
MLVWGGFAFLFTETVLVPAIPVFGCRELADEPDVRIGRTDSEVVGACGPLSVHLPIGSGKFPDALSILPKLESCSAVALKDAQAAELLLALPALPGAASEDRPVTLDLNDGFTIRARDEGTRMFQGLNLRRSRPSRRSRVCGAGSRRRSPSPGPQSSSVTAR